jgi:hypothetical protein
MVNICSISIGKPEGKRPLGRPTRKCEDNIKMNLMEIGWRGVNWTHIWVPRGGGGKDLLDIVTISLSRRALLQQVHTWISEHTRVYPKVSGLSR